MGEDILFEFDKYGVFPIIIMILYDSYMFLPINEICGVSHGSLMVPNFHMILTWFLPF